MTTETPHVLLARLRFSAMDTLSRETNRAACRAAADWIIASVARDAMPLANLRQNYDAFTAMRNDINSLIGDMQSSESTLLRGPEMSHECEAVVRAVAAYVAAALAREAKLREALHYYGSGTGDMGEPARAALEASK